MPLVGGWPRISSTASGQGCGWEDINGASRWSANAVKLSEEDLHALHELRRTETPESHKKEESADRSRRPLCCFAGAQVLKGRWASAFLGSFTVGQKTGDNFMLVYSFANVVILGQKMTQRGYWSNGEVGPHLHPLFPLFHILLRFVLRSNAIFHAQSRQIAVAEFARCYSTHLTEFFGFLGIKQFEFCHFRYPPWMAVARPPINPLGLETANQGPGFQPDGIIIRKKGADRSRGAWGAGLRYERVSNAIFDLICVACRRAPAR